jgi:hypothetical protein
MTEIFEECEREYSEMFVNTSTKYITVSSLPHGGTFSILHFRVNFSNNLTISILGHFLYEKKSAMVLNFCRVPSFDSIDVYIFFQLYLISMYMCFLNFNLGIPVINCVTETSENCKHYTNYLQKFDDPDFQLNNISTCLVSLK